jgi:hypothetical protein
LIKRYFNKYFELVFWATALIALAFADPAGPPHFSLCPFKALGISWCPGCGIGHAILWLFYGSITNSLHAHWLGIPALGGILYRIYTLAANNIFRKQPFPLG